jgi:hypothetical protein
VLFRFSVICQMNLAEDSKFNPSALPQPQGHRIKSVRRFIKANATLVYLKLKFVVSKGCARTPAK